MTLKITNHGYLFIAPEDDCQRIIDIMLAIEYDKEYCISMDFNPEFVGRLMEAGFLVMSTNLAEEGAEDEYLLLLQLHLVRSALFFDNLHIKKSIRRFINRYKLCPDTEFDYIIERCVEKHGSGWLTSPLVDCIKKIRQNAVEKQPFNHAPCSLKPVPYAYPACFALYREDSDGTKKLVAGEFGVVCGNVYTSYSGYYDEDNAGTVQIILTTRYLQENGFLFFDMGMPLNYKTDLGATDISPDEFIRLFRA